MGSPKKKLIMLTSAAVRLCDLELLKDLLQPDDLLLVLLLLVDQFLLQVLGPLVQLLHLLARLLSCPLI